MSSDSKLCQDWVQDTPTTADPAALKVDRRQFLEGAAAFVLAVGWGAAARADSSVAGLGEHPQGNASPALFIAVDGEGTVHLTCHRSEMGQQIWTAVAQVLAEELAVDWEQVNIVQALGLPRYGDQNTDGSRSIRNNFDRLRLAGAAARMMFEREAAKRWGVRPSSCAAKHGAVVHAASSRRFGFGELAAGAFEQPVPRAAQIKLKRPADWGLIRRDVPSLTLPHLIRGEGTFGIDVRLPDMLYAVIARPPQVQGKVRGVDQEAALRVPGVARVVRMPELVPPVLFKPLGGVAVVARDTWAAIQGRKALRIDWDPGPNAHYDSAAFEQTLWQQVRNPGQVRRNRGDVEAGLADAAQRVVAEYYVPHLPHAPMEPPAAAARWSGDKVECWGSVQAPQRAREVVAGVCGVSVEQVTIHVTWLGGAFGRKSKPDHFAEVAWIARAVQAPVKLTWTREDDLQHDYYHTVSAQRLEAGLDHAGGCVAMLHRTAFPPIATTFDPAATSPSWGDLRQGASDAPFAIPNLRLESGQAQAHLRIGWLRSVANIYHAFALQSFVAELAHAAGRDAKDYLLQLIGPPRQIDPNAEGAEYDNYGSSLQAYPIDTGRLAHVTRRAASMADWGRSLKPGHGLGVAAHRSFASYVATVIEVAVDPQGHLTVVGVWSCMDAGTVVNPNHVASQLEGGTLFGLSHALYGEITACEGAVEQSNFPEFRLLRMNEAPRHMAVEIVESSAPPGGVGEPPTPPAAPALTNAIFNAVGLRIRRLPVFDRTRRDRLPVSAQPQRKGT